MAGEVFISYAREDTAFVRRLHAELASHQRDAWVDWEDIPLTADWWQEICGGIEAADTFVFIISPDSAQSEVCFREIEHATQHHKRMMPIMHRELDPIAEQKLHPSINAHNWIFIRESDDFTASVRALLEAMDTDLSYVREHTRLLIRARSWENSQHDNSQLLRDSELQRAESWLAEGLVKERNRPSDLHVEFIKSSRRAANRRRQRNLGLTLIVAVILGLFIASLLLREEARRQRDIAQEQRQEALLAKQDAEEQGLISKAIGLAAQAQLELFGSFPERGVLLALEALENLPYVWQADRALGAAVQESRARSMFEGHTAQVQAVAWSPDGTHVVTASNDKTAIVWDAANGDMLFTLNGHIAEVISVAWSPDSAYIVTGSRDETGKIWDAATGTPLETLFGHTDWITDVAWSPDGTVIATASADNTVRLWDVTAWLASRDRAISQDIYIQQRLSAQDTSLPVTVLEGHEGSVNALDWKPDNSALVTVSNDQTIRIWDAATGAQITQFGDHNEGISVVDWSPDGSIIVTGSRDDTARVWDAATGTLKFTLGQHISDITGVMIAPNNSLIATTSRDRTIRTWDTASGAPVFTTSGHQDDVTGVDWSPDSTRLVTCSDDRKARSWDAVPGDDVFTLADHTGRVTGAAWSPNGNYLVTISTDNDVRLWTIADPPTNQRLSGHTGSIAGVAWSHDGTRIATASTDSTVRFWNAMTGETIAVLEANAGPLNSVAWSPDDALIVTTSRRSARVWEVASGYELFSLDHTDPVNWADFAPDGSRVLTASRDGSIRLWDAATQTEQLVFDRHGEAVNDAAWSPDGTLIISGGDDGLARIWDAATGDELAILGGHTDSVIGVDWSPDGTRVITASLDHTARVWDASTSNELLVLAGHADQLSGVAWSPTGEYAVTTSGDMTARIWHTWQTPRDLVEFARDCCVFRELTPDERTQFDLQSDLQTED